MTGGLSPAQKLSFERDGYLRLAGFASPDQLATLAELCGALLATAAAKAGPAATGLDLHWIRITGTAYAAIAALPLFSRTLDIAAGEGATDGTRIFASVFHKRARTKTVVPWHQDCAYYQDGASYRGFTIWLPLADTDAGNGCLQYLPGSHRPAPLRHGRWAHDPSGFTLAAEDVDASRAQALPLVAGDAAMHYLRTLHYSGPNHTAHARTALTLRVLRHVHGLPLVAGQRPTPDSIFDLFGERGARSPYRTTTLESS